MANKIENIDKVWLLWQVASPLLAPIGISAVVVGAWATGNPQFTPSASVIVDVTPWALTFYSLTLIGSTFYGFWPKLATNAMLGVGLMLTAMAVTLYASFMVVWRHDPKFTPGIPVYGVTIFLLAVSVILSHNGHKAGRDQ